MHALIHLTLLAACLAAAYLAARPRRASQGRHGPPAAPHRRE
ncbi:hypothetical protein SBC1_31490 [Caballeronia sp. SBC1]|nr:hypothetical protein SBC1_31490 [Caballeronia sp. SBC1]